VLILNIRNNWGNTPLHFWYPKLDFLTLLLQAGADPYIVNKKGLTALDCWANREEVVRHLIKGRLMYLQSQMSLRTLCVSLLKTHPSLSLATLPLHIQSELTESMKINVNDANQ
jgi:ankyrin repeat protein